ncbi:MAG: hypothetical protein E6G97_17745 [Alphaproteobacteria bacterium]|jgi:hypothetical protein|nr:MAG: hypothetical protein E6G97_17745 [Alphaproteobacteria bacterium]
MAVEKTLVDLMESQVGLHCPTCLGRLNAELYEYGRCSRCHTSVASMTVAELPVFTVETDKGSVSFHADNAQLARELCRKNGLCPLD